MITGKKCQSAITINVKEVERISCFRFQQMQISDELARTQNRDTILKKAQQRLHLLRFLRRWVLAH